MSLDNTTEGYLRFLKYSNEGKRIVLSLEKIFDFKRKLRFLDVGAGDGRIIIPLSKKVGFTVALEPSEYLANLLKSKIKDKSNVEIIMKNIEEYKTFDKFDFILLCHTLYFIKDWHRVFEKLINMLNNQGYLVIILHSNSGRYYDFLNEFQQDIDPKVGHENFLQAINTLGEFGFNPKQFQIKYKIIIPNFEDMKKMFNFFFGKSYYEINSEVKEKILKYIKQFEVKNQIIVPADDMIVWVQKRE